MAGSATAFFSRLDSSPSIHSFSSGGSFYFAEPRACRRITFRCRVGFIAQTPVLLTPRYYRASLSRASVNLFEMRHREYIASFENNRPRHCPVHRCSVPRQSETWKITLSRTNTTLTIPSQTEREGEREREKRHKERNAKRPNSRIDQKVVERISMRNEKRGKICGASRVLYTTRNSI